MFMDMEFFATCHIFRISSLQEVLNVQCVNGLHRVVELSATLAK